MTWKTCRAVRVKNHGPKSDSQASVKWIEKQLSSIRREIGLDNFYGSYWLSPTGNSFGGGSSQSHETIAMMIDDNVDRAFNKVNNLGFIFIYHPQQNDKEISVGVTYKYPTSKQIEVLKDIEFGANQRNQKINWTFWDRNNNSKTFDHFEDFEKYAIARS